MLQWLLDFPGVALYSSTVLSSACAIRGKIYSYEEFMEQDRGYQEAQVLWELNYQGVDAATLSMFVKRRGYFSKSGVIMSSHCTYMFSSLLNDSNASSALTSSPCGNLNPTWKYLRLSVCSLCLHWIHPLSYLVEMPNAATAHQKIGILTLNHFAEG